VLVYIIGFCLTLFFANRAAIARRRYYRAKNPCDNKILESNTENLVINRGSDHIRELRWTYFLYFFAAFLPLFLISALRYGIGTDYFFTYVPSFNLILSGKESPYTEWGFTFLNKLIQLFTDNVQWLFVVTGFIYTFVLIKVITNYSKNAILSVLFILLSGDYFTSLNNLRQSIAVIICLAAIPYMQNNKFFKYFLCICAASLFHITSFLMILPYIIVQIKFIKKNFLIVAFLLTLLLPVFCRVFVWLVSFTKYGYYFEDYNIHEVTTVNILYHLFFFVEAWLVLGKKRETDKMSYILLVMQFFAFYISAASIFISIPELITRLTFYFQIFQLLLIPYMYVNIKGRRNRFIFVIIFILLYGAYFIHFTVISGVNEVLPYRSIFSR